MAENQNIPLVVDLDGTLIRSDLMWESLARRLRRNPFAIFQILFWWSRGRARLKQKLAEKVQVAPEKLPLNEKFLAWLREEKISGRQIILATASDLKMAQPIARHIGIFDEVLASDGKTNLRSENKLRALTEKFGERSFDYAGNSAADFAVWRGSRQAVVVNASPAVLRAAANCTALGPVFCDNFSHFTIAKSVGTELFLRSGYLLAIFSGLLLALAFPKTNFAGFAWVAPAVLMFAAHGKSGADAFRAGYVGGLSFWLVSLHWLLLIPYAWHGIPFLPALGWFALAAYVALFTGVWTWLVSGFKLQVSSWAARGAWTLAAAAAWVALEMLRARLLGGFPWSFVGVSQYQLMPLIQIASVTGVYGISFLVVWFSLALFCAAKMILQNPTKRHVWQAEIILPLVVVIFCFTGGMFQLNRRAPADKVLRVAMVQPSIPQTVIWDAEESEKSFQKFLAANDAALTNEIDLVIWPESAVPVMNAENCRAISAFALKHRAWIILNGEDVTVTATEKKFFNAAFLVNPQGELTATYHKQKLVIFGEYVPLARWLPFLKWFTPIEGGWTPGEKPATFEVEFLTPPRLKNNSIEKLAGTATGAPAKAAPLICFEDTFATVARAAAQDDIDFLVNLTNDGWFGNSSEQWQHMANSVFRCVENGLPLLRCANNGVTCVIDAHGRVGKIFRDGSNSEYGAGILQTEIPLLASAEKSAPTFYNRHGDWFGWGCVGIAAWLFLKTLRTPPGKKSDGLDTSTAGIKAD